MAPSDPIVTGLGVLAVYATDLDRSRKFYEEVLGFEFSGDMSPGVLLKAGDLSLYLEAGRTPSTAPGLERSTLSACLATSSVRAAWDRLQAAGVRVVEEYILHGESFAMFRVADPDGNVLEFAGTP
jgi:catechol 2,3-dioxygenase-like lactoylglutathione lyase family enzyme